jgi:hypothetical protein
MPNTVRVRLLAADVDLHCEFVSAAESLLPWPLFALSDLDYVDCLCLPVSRLPWKLLALPDLDHVDCLCLPGFRLLWKLPVVYVDRRLEFVLLLESRLLLRLPFFWRLMCCVPVMFFFLVASFSIPKKRWANWKHCYLFDKQEYLFDCALGYWYEIEVIRIFDCYQRGSEKM